MQVRFVRRSDLRPQRMMGVVGQKWRTSGYHCDALVSMASKASTLGTNLIEDVLERIRTVNGEAHEEQICLRI